MDTQDTWIIVGSAAGVATAVATLVSAITTFVLRHIDRPSADWAFDLSWHRDRDRKGNPSGPLVLQGVLTNAGDGHAFRVTTSARVGEAEFVQVNSETDSSSRRRVPFVALLGPGHAFHLRVSGITDDNLEEARLTLRWIESPTRKKKVREQSWSLVELAETPPKAQRSIRGDDGCVYWEDIE